MLRYRDDASKGQEQVGLGRPFVGTTTTCRRPKYPMQCTASLPAGNVCQYASCQIPLLPGLFREDPEIRRAPSFDGPESEFHGSGQGCSAAGSYRRARRSATFPRFPEPIVETVTQPARSGRQPIPFELHRADATQRRKQLAMFVEHQQVDDLVHGVAPDLEALTVQSAHFE